MVLAVDLFTATDIVNRIACRQITYIKLLAFWRHFWCWLLTSAGR